MQFFKGQILMMYPRVPRVSHDSDFGPEWGIQPGLDDNNYFQVNSDINSEYGSLPSCKLTYLWNITIFNGKIHYKWQFSIAM